MGELTDEYTRAVKEGNTALRDHIINGISTGTLNELSSLETPKPGRTPIEEFANAIVRRGAKFDLRHSFEGLSEALEFYKAARDLNPADHSLSENYMIGLTNLKWFAERENKSLEVIRQIEENIAKAQKYHQDIFHIDYQSLPLLT